MELGQLTGAKSKSCKAEGDEDKYGNQNTDGSFQFRSFTNLCERQEQTPVRMLINASSSKVGS